MEQIENRAVIDSEWKESVAGENLPVCGCCEEIIKQFRALHILSGRTRVWLCDRCIEDMKEVTGW